MAEHFPINFDKLYGGMTTEYFAFFCPKCHREIKDLFIDENKTMAVYNAKVRCGPCGVTYGFKLVKSLGNLSKQNKANSAHSWRFGVKPVAAIGESFGPEKHEAVSQVESAQEPNRVISELGKAHLFHERLLRPAKVLLSKAPPEKKAETK